MRLFLSFFTFLKMGKDKKKTPEQSQTVMTEIVFPNDANPMGYLQGGKLMHWMDTAAAICAQTHAENICVTASVDHLSFKKKIEVGDVVTIKAKITRSFTTSMEIYVEALARKIKTSESYLANYAYFTFVAIDEKSKPGKVPLVNPQTKEEINQYNKAEVRKNNRLKQNN